MLFRHIGELVTNDPAQGDGPLGILHDAALLAVTGAVAWTGPDARAPDGVDAITDLDGRAVVPGFVDSHTHLVFAGDRRDEFCARMAGAHYGAGGIAATVEHTRQATDNELDDGVRRLVAEAARSGTTTIECKSGYGLTVADEARSLTVARRHTEETTFLGAHVVPIELAGNADAYVDLVCTEMLASCAPTARWIDVFCDRGAFDAEQSARILRAGAAAGLTARVHANQLGRGDGVRVAVEAGAASADHCNHLSDGDIDLLAGGETVATLLPAADYSTPAPYADARRLIDAGVSVALATDCNPGSSYTTSMPFCVALAVRELHMTPDEALWSATIGGARALRREDVGHLTVGSRADLVVLDAPSHIYLSYRPGVDLVAATYRGGDCICARVSQRSSPDLTTTITTTTTTTTTTRS